ncbi:uncharacterized protein LOC133917836 [Phragmites australis]|uniref:uncharacterized protein LOC133917836 n=1 Tax=Phragmites australis TaxID=29695 RepID=UPI002D79D959|nr:uncharacterized protein LOC133917836 [Phragmites australis]
MVFCANPDRVALQAMLPEFDTQGLTDRPGRQNPGTIQIPGVDEATGERAERGPAPPTGAGESQGRLETPRSAPPLEPGAPEPSAPAEPEPSITAVEPGLAGTAAEPVSTTAEPRPANVAVETEMQPLPCSEPTTTAAPDRLAPSESARARRARGR